MDINISYSEKDFKQNFGDDIWLSLTKDVPKESCKYCGFSPSNKDILQFHLSRVDLDPSKSSIDVLCNACHATQHVDKSLGLGWVRLVNSRYTQAQLTQICRANQLQTNYENRWIVDLSVEPGHFLSLFQEHMKKGKIKVVFTQNFAW